MSFLYLLYIEIIFIILTMIGTLYLKFALKYLNRTAELVIISLIFITIAFFKILIQKEMLNKTKNLNKRLGVVHTTNYLEQLNALSLANYEMRNISDYLIRFWESLELKYLYSDVLKNIIIDLNILFFAFCFLFLYNETFFHFYVLISILYALYQILFQNQSYKIEYDMLKEKNNYQRILLEEIENIPIYYYLNQRQLQKQEMEKSLITYLEKNNEKETFYNTALFYQVLLKDIANILLILLGIFLIGKEKITIIDFVLIEGIGAYIMNALENLTGQMPKEKYLKNILRKNYEFLDTQKELSKQNNSNISLGDIKIEKLTFTYNQYQYVLKDLNLNITIGTHLLLLGKSGCGKSTLCKLLTKIYEPTHGKITIGNQNILDIDSFTIRSQITYLEQESHLITGTIKENIIMHRNFDASKFNKVCEICHIEEIVSKKPLRYETTILSQENNFSGGEKQRIVLARALYSDAKIFLLDESLCEVDETLEKAIIKEMREYLKNKTLVYISHKNYKALFDDVEKLEGSHERVLIS